MEHAIKFFQKWISMLTFVCTKNIFVHTNTSFIDVLVCTKTLLVHTNVNIEIHFWKNVIACSIMRDNTLVQDITWPNYIYTTIHVKVHTKSGGGGLKTTLLGQSPMSELKLFFTSGYPYIQCHLILSDNCLSILVPQPEGLLGNQ